MKITPRGDHDDDDDDDHPIWSRSQPTRPGTKCPVRKPSLRHRCRLVHKLRMMGKMCLPEVEKCLPEVKMCLPEVEMMFAGSGDGLAGSGDMVAGSGDVVEMDRKL